MKVEELMTRDVYTCPIDGTLDEPARIMSERDCGSVPVLDDMGKVVAMITDRDITLAALATDQPLSKIETSTACSKRLVAVRPRDHLDDVEALMKQHQIRRVPVIDDRGRPVGILAMGDLATHVRVNEDDRSELSADAIASTLAGVSEPKHLHGMA